MAKRGPNPKGVAFDRLESAIRSDILNAIDSAAGESAKAIYDRFGLSQREVSWTAFRRVVEKRRGDRGIKGSRDQETEDGEAPSWEELDELMRANIATQVRAGSARVYECAAVIRRCFEERAIRIQEKAEQRAQVKFDAWKIKHEEEQRAKAERAERLLQKEGISDEALSRIRSIYGLDDDDDGEPKAH